MAFTVIDGDTSWQDLAIAQELATSYNYRRSVFGLSTVSAPTEASLVFAFIQALQNGIEEMMGYDYFGSGEYYGWLLNTAALSTYTGQSAFPTPLTLATGMTAAGLTASGYWRRIAQGGTQPAVWTNYAAAGWSYGKITDKDLAGPWLFKDLQIALQVLTRPILPATQTRRKWGYYNGFSATFPSTAMSWDAWTSSIPDSYYDVAKTKNSGGVVYYITANLSLQEVRFDLVSSLSAKEASRLVLTIPWDGNPSYASKASKTAYANLGVSDVTTSFNLTVSNTSTKTVSGGTLSYNAVVAEDTNNIVPLADNILPDSNVPSGAALSVSLRFYKPLLIIDFTFE